MTLGLSGFQKDTLIVNLDPLSYTHKDGNTYSVVPTVFSGKNGVPLSDRLLFRLYLSVRLDCRPRRLFLVGQV